jgi:aryl-alcohol dehydrogenase-like predicted oxidoreductase
MSLKIKKLGSSDLAVTDICLGTMTFGEQNTEAQGHEQLDYALSRGVNFIDTAEMYPVQPSEKTFGATETIIGNWLKKSGKRKDIVLASKVAGPSRGMSWIRGGAEDLTKEDIIAACDASLKRLQTDVIDLYQIHWPNRNTPAFGALYFNPARDKKFTPIEEQLEAMQVLVNAGKIRYVGLSNETPYGMGEFFRLAEKHNLPKPVAVQNAYNIINRHVENGLYEQMYRYDVGLLAYSPLAFGRLTMKYERGPKFGESSTPRGRLEVFPPTWSPRYMRPEVIDACEAYNMLAQKNNMTATQLALAFCYQKACVTSTIIGATTVEQLKENIDAYEQKISPELFEEIDEIRWRLRDPAQ